MKNGKAIKLKNGKLLGVGGNRGVKDSTKRPYPRKPNKSYVA